MAVKSKRGLGKGLNALFSDAITEEINVKKHSAKQDNNENDKTGEMIVKLSLIVPNAGQPRKEFNKELLEELTESVRQYGVLQPLIVKKNGMLYEIITGERRWRAAQAAGLKEIPVVVREYSKQKALEISIIENVQRADLNPIEEAKAYQMLMLDFGLKQEEVADKVAKNRTTITNTLRLLKLDERVQIMMIEGVISSGHARALLATEDGNKQKEIADLIVEKKLSVREVERLVKEISIQHKKKDSKDDGPDLTLYFREYENRIRTKLGTKVHINRKDKNKGRIEIDYYSSAELERLMDIFNSMN